MKRLGLVCLLITLFLVSCSGGTDSKYHMDDLPDGAYYIGEDTGRIFPYNNRIYTSNRYNVGYYDTSDWTYTELYSVDEDGTYDITVNENGIYFIKNKTVYNLGEDGELKNTYGIDMDVRDWSCAMAVNGKYIAVGINDYEEDKPKLALYSFKTGETEMFDYTPVREGDGIARMYVGSDDGEFFLRGYYSFVRFTPGNGRFEEVVPSNVMPIDFDYLPEIDRIYAIYDNMHWGCEAALLCSFDSDGGGKETTRTIGFDGIFSLGKAAAESAGREMTNLGLRYAYFTGYDYILHDRYNSMIYVYNPCVNDTGEELNVVASGFTDWLDGLNVRYENDKSIPVKTKVYPADEFSERLRVKLLAGDTDYDVVMLDNSEGLLASILKYNLFLPLEGYENITEGFEKYIDGVEGLMTYDGHIYGIPFKLGAFGLATKKDNESELTVNYSLDEFWNVCEASGGTRLLDINDDTQQAVFVSIVSSVIEDGAEKGSISKDALLDCIVKYQEYYEMGALKTSLPSSGKLRVVFGVGEVIGTGGDHFAESESLRAMPSYNGKRYVDVEEMLYISSVSPNPDIAADYLAYAVSDDHIAERYSYGKSFLAKDPDSYTYYYMTGHDIIDNPAFERGYAWVKRPWNVSENQRFLIENGADLFANSVPRLYTTGMDEIFEEVYKSLADGSMTPEKAADKIYSDASYRIME